MKKVISIFTVLFLTSTGIAAACYVPVTPTPTDLCSNLPEVQAEVPEGYFMVEGVCTPNEVTPTVSPEVTPEASESATVTPEPTQAVVFSGVSDGRSQGSDGLCSKPPCVQGGVVVPQGPPDTSARE